MRRPTQDELAYMAAVGAFTLLCCVFIFGMGLFIVFGGP